MTAVNPFFFWQSGGNNKIAAYGISHLSICMIFSLVSMVQWVFDRCLTGGTPTAFMQGLTSVAGILMNTVLVAFPLLLLRWLVYL